jgi:hypothetical protein
MQSATVRRWLVSGLIAAVAAGAPSALAADNVPGKWHEDKVVGYRFRPLNEWETIPSGTDPEDPRIIGFYSDKAKFDNTAAKPECSVYAFKQAREGTATPSDAPAAPAAEPTDEERLRQAIANSRYQNTRQVFEYLRDRRMTVSQEVMNRMEDKKRKKILKELDIKDPVEKDVKQDDVTLKVLECTVPLAMVRGNEEFIQGWKIVAGWVANEEFEVGVVYQLPLEAWKKYGRGVYSSLASIEFLDGEEVAAARQDLADALAGKTGDERWLEEIKRKVTPGWDHLQTKNYLIVFDKTVKKDRIKLIAQQIEAIRLDVYEKMFPADRPITAISVVRVCKDNAQYGQYGGPGGSAGYWNWVDQELVFYEDTSAKKDSLRVLNHEAFHQYIFYSVGSISPHDWFNEGHGDYFSGHNYDRSGRFVPKPFSWRTGIIKSAIGSKSYVPLKQFMRYTHAQYYGPQIGQNYAQGWSVIWFLRQQRNPEWKGILETYFNTLKGEVTKWVKDQEEAAKKDGSWKEGWKPGITPNDVEEAARQKAFDAAFGGWDDRKWDKFEKEWKDFL